MLPAPAAGSTVAALRSDEARKSHPSALRLRGRSRLGPNRNAGPNGVAATPSGCARASVIPMETKTPIPPAILVGIQLPEVDDTAHEASLAERGRLERLAEHAALVAEAAGLDDEDAVDRGGGDPHGRV